MVEGFLPISRVLPPVTTDFEGGNERQRPRPGDNVGTVGQTIIMDSDPFIVFTTWWKVTLNNGTARFNAPVWLGTDFETKVCQFTKDGKPADTFYVPGAVKVAMKFRVFDI